MSGENPVYYKLANKFENLSRSLAMLQSDLDDLWDSVANEIPEFFEDEAEEKDK